MPSSELYSHPDRLLEDHLIGAAKLSEIFLLEKPAKIKEQLTDISRIIVLSHDIGKATAYFQEYLKADDKEKERLKNQKETKHSLLSAVCAYYLIKEIGADEPYPFFAFFTVRRHHGNLIDVIDGVLFDDNDGEVLHKQCKSIDDKKFSLFRI